MCLDECAPHVVADYSELERRVVIGLEHQWREEIDILPKAYRNRMVLPYFGLYDFSGRWARWDPDKREIGIARRLVMDHPWDSVRDVLRHEMAHQLVDQVWHVAESPHGPSFHQACRMLRADPAAAGNCQQLSQAMRDGNVSSNDRILFRVKKLLALAQSRFRHEAETAMAKAHEQIAKYNLDLMNARQERSFHSICVGRPALRHPRQDYRIAQLLEDFYFVRAIWVPMYVIRNGKMGRVLELCGTTENLKLADYVHDFVHRFISEQWQAFGRQNRSGRRRKVDFAIGVVEGFGEKLQAQVDDRIRSGDNTFALIKHGDPELDRYYQYMHPRISSVQCARLMVAQGVRDAGRSAGHKLVISKPIERSESRGRLLGT